MRTELLAAALLAAAAPAFAAAAEGEAASLVVLDTDFIVEIADENGDIIRHSSTTVPLVPDSSCFRWQIKVAPAMRVVPIVELFELPSPPGQWTGVEDMTESPTRTSADGRVATTDIMAPLNKGLIEHGWCIAEGDPAGRYRITVSENGRLLHRFQFTVK